jgi:hypothetical protein
MEAACLSNWPYLKDCLRGSQKGCATLPTSFRRLSNRNSFWGSGTLPLQPFQFGQFVGKRRVASFGFRYDYDLRQLQRAEPVPGWLAETVEKIETFGGPSTRIRQVLCTEYDVGVGIGWHRDKPHFDRIFGLSLEASIRERRRTNCAC